MPLISIVDDDLSVRRALRRLVQSAGYSAETFASAREFLDSSPSGRTACLVLDIHLEGMSGFELQERLAADPDPIPIIFITAHDDAATRERARQTERVRVPAQAIRRAGPARCDRQGHRGGRSGWASAGRTWDAAGVQAALTLFSNRPGARF